MTRPLTRRKVLEGTQGCSPRGCESLDVLYEDEWLIAIDKPTGLLSQPGISVEDSVATRVKFARPEATGSMMVHRLDMDTSGIILLAKDAATHRDLQQQFERRETFKRYRALLERAPSGAAGRIVLPLRLDTERRPYQIVDTALGRPSETAWYVPRGAEAGEILFLPRTGRTHQLRVHAADARGLDNPIRGDRLYGRQGGRLYLHAERLGFRHPASGIDCLLIARAPFGTGAG